MRVIKFRGLYKGIFVYGNLIQGVYDGKPFTQIENTDNNDFEKWDVDPETVGEYSGMTNKDGDEIFEGDIIACNNQNCVVVFGKRTCGFGYHVKYSTAWNVIDKFYRLNTKDKVLGNAHENPELLAKTL